MDGKEIRARRNALGLSQPALCAILGVRERTLRDWEYDKRKKNKASDNLLMLTFTKLEAEVEVA